MSSKLLFEQTQPTASDVLEAMAPHEIEWLDHIVATGGEITDCFVWPLHRLWRRNLVMKLRYELNRYYCVDCYQITPLGKQVHQYFMAIPEDKRYRNFRNYPFEEAES